MTHKMLTFRVIGRGEFPFDMLRYDACWPADSESASRLATPPCYTGEDVYAKFRHDRRVITLRTYQEHKWWEPTKGRWSSFGWTVIDERIFTGLSDAKITEQLNMRARP